MTKELASSCLPACFWITGFSGAGKTTVALLLRQRLQAAGLPVLVLDGDKLRAAIDPDAGHDLESRRKLAFAYARLCAELAQQNVVVICATISMFHAVRDWNRAHIPGYREIYLKVPLDERTARDPKKLYAREAKNMVGRDDVAEEPQTPDLTIDNYDTLKPEDAAAQIFQAFCAEKLRAP